MGQSIVGFFLGVALYYISGDTTLKDRLIALCYMGVSASFLALSLVEDWATMNVTWNGWPSEAAIAARQRGMSPESV